MTRFINPHMQHQHMVARQAQHPMNTNMMPMQGNMQGNNMQQPMPIGNNMFQYPNGLVVQLTPNGLIPVNMNPNMQPNMMPMQPGNMMPMQPGNMMPMMPHMQNIQPNVNRFGPPSNNVNQGLSITSVENENIGNRYQHSGSIDTMQEVVEIIPETFTVAIEKNIKFDNNNKLVLNTYVEEVKESQINNAIEKCTITDCFEEAVECVTEVANDESNNKLITIQQIIISNSYYKAVNQDKFNEIIFGDDIKGIYKALKTAFPTLSSKYDVNLINALDTILTDYINDYIKVNATISVNIDSFMSDFNDLLKVVRNNEEDLEDTLVEYINEVIAGIKGNIELVTEHTDDNKKATYIPETYSLCYVDKFSHELGIGNTYNEFVKIDDNIANTFIMSLSKSVCSKLNSNNFYLITIDKCIVKIMQNNNGFSFIKKIA